MGKYISIYLLHINVLTVYEFNLHVLYLQILVCWFISVLWILGQRVLRLIDRILLIYVCMLWLEKFKSITQLYFPMFNSYCLVTVHFILFTLQLTLGLLQYPYICVFFNCHHCMPMNYAMFLLLFYNFFLNRLSGFKYVCREPTESWISDISQFLDVCVLCLCIMSLYYSMFNLKINVKMWNHFRLFCMFILDFFPCLQIPK